jgi:hypothetical protein
VRAYSPPSVNAKAAKSCQPRYWLTRSSIAVQAPLLPAVQHETVDLLGVTPLDDH